MRIQTFELIAFGPFTDNRMEFSDGSEGLHLVYGANEAGKSSALRALTHLFYGIPPRSSDNFVHRHQDLRIGGEIRRSSGDTLQFVRRKGNKNTLLSPSGEPLPDSLLTPYLGTVTRELFRMIYGMDHARLIEGGNDLATAKGDIGTSLFSAGMGIAGMKEVLISLENEAAELFKPAARKNPKVTRLISKFNDVEKECRQKSLSANKWVVHDRQLNRIMKQKQEVEDKLREFRAEHHRLERIQKAIPIIVRLQKLREEVARLGDVTFLPAGFADQRRELQESMNRSNAALIRREKEYRDIKKSMSEISPAAPLIQFQEDINQLFLLSGSHKKALFDLPKRRADLHRLNEEAESVLKRLGKEYRLSDAERFRLGDAQVARIRKLGRELDPQTERQQSARKKAMDLGQEVEIARQKLADMGILPDTTRLVKARDNAVKLGDLEERYRNAVADQKKYRKEADIALAGLGLWEGSLEALASLPVPSADTVSRFDSDFSKLEARIERLTDETAKQKEQMIALDREAEEMQAGGTIPTEAELMAARKHRDQGWQLILTTWLEHRVDTEKRRAFMTHAGNRHGDRDLAEAYAISVEQADRVGDRLRNESDRVAKLGSCRARRNECARKVADIDRDLALVRESEIRLNQEWRSLWNALGVDPLKPKEMAAWLQKHRMVAKAASDLRERETQAEQLKALIAGHCDHLVACLTDLDCGPRDKTENLEQLIHRAEAVITSANKARSDHEVMTATHGDLERQLRQAESERQQVDRSLSDWREQWALAIAPLGLDGRSLPEEVDTVLAWSQQLFDRLDKARTMKGRVRAMEADAEKFTEEVDKLCRKVSFDPEGLSPEDAVARLHEQLKTALADNARRGELKKQKESLGQVILKERAAIEDAETQMNQLCRTAGNVSVDELPEIERRSEEALEKKARMEKLNEELAGYSAGTDIDAFIDQLTGVDFDSLPAEIEELTDGISTLEVERSELDQAIGSETAALKLMDGSAAASHMAEKSQSILAEMREAVGQYARIQLASAILRAEIERYREANQGPILKRAGEIFNRLTLDSFSSLRPEYDDRDQPVLMGVRSSAEKVPIAAMSDGTRDQLYLALRLAGIEQRLLTDEPMPLVLDDILVNFDDERSQATLSVLAEFSKKTQVLFFTHHRHLVEMARDTVTPAGLFTHSLD